MYDEINICIYMYIDKYIHVYIQKEGLAIYGSGVGIGHYMARLPLGYLERNVTKSLTVGVCPWQ